MFFHCFLLQKTDLGSKITSNPMSSIQRRQKILVSLCCTSRHWFDTSRHPEPSKSACPAFFGSEFDFLTKNKNELSCFPSREIDQFLDYFSTWKFSLTFQKKVATKQKHLKNVCSFTKFCDTFPELMKVIFQNWRCP